MVSDEQLVARAQHGDTAATDALMARYERAALWNAAQFYDHTADREDLAQEARVGLFKAVRDYQPSLGAFNPFAFLCIRRQIITAVKTSTRGKHSALTHAVRVVSNDEGDQVQAVDRIEAANTDPALILAERAQLETVVRTITEAMSPLERASIVGVVFDGRTYQEIGETKSLDNALQRARRKLAVALAEADVVPLGRAA